MNCKNIQYNVNKPLGKNVNVDYRRLLTFSAINVLINVYYYFSDV